MPWFMGFPSCSTFFCSSFLIIAVSQKSLSKIVLKKQQKRALNKELRTTVLGEEII
jgi:hypothetical protein